MFQVLLLVEKLRETFKDMITELPWMGEDTKNVAKEKVFLVFVVFMTKT